MTRSIILEICADSVASALAAERGGAHRIELCSNLVEGGITPSLGLMAAVRERVKIKLHAMIRPRGGDFCYTAEEYDVIHRDIESAKRVGADGVVLGILDEDAAVDVGRCRRLIELARPLTATFHRAFDLTRDLDAALRDVAETGADRLLTSGGRQTAEAGIPAIASLVYSARGQPVIMAGSGISEVNARRIVEETGVCEIHASLRESFSGPMRVIKEDVSIAAVRGRDYEREMVSEERVRRLLAAVNGD